MSQFLARLSSGDLSPGLLGGNAHAAVARCAAVDAHASCGWAQASTIQKKRPGRLYLIDMARDACPSRPLQQREGSPHGKVPSRLGHHVEWQ